MSSTLRGAYHLSAFGLVLLAGLAGLAHMGAGDAVVAAYADLATWLVGAVGAGLGVYGSRHLPTANRAPTSAELRQQANR